MDVDPEFNLEVVKDFIVTRHGKVTNHELVSHFKPFLSNPDKKAINREKFKDFVNTLASVKEEDGEKVLVLKKKFRKGTPLAAEASSGKRDKKKKGQTSTDEGAAADGAEDALPSPSLPESEFSSSISSTKDEPEGSNGEEYKPEESITIPTQSIQVQESGQEQSMSPQPNATGPENDIKQELRPPSVVLTKPSVSDDEEVGGTSEGNGAIRIRKAGPAEGQQTTVVLETPGESSTDPDDVFNKSSDQPDGPPKRTEGDASKPPASPTGMSVKERAKHLNKMESDSNLHSSNVKMRKHTHGDRRDEDSSSVSSAGYTPMDALDREWMVVSAAADYHPMHKLLNQKPELAKKRDFITSALHWAAKHGKPDVIKLLCGNQEQRVNINARSGYTPLHLAAMNGHEDIIELLVHGYSAEPNIRDYSGKKAKQYLRNSASSRTQQILQNRRTSSTTGPFKRSGSYSAKIHKSGYFGIHGMSAIRNSWIAGTESSQAGGRISRSPSMSPSPSPRSSPAPSPGSQRKGSKLGRPPPPPVRPPQPPPRRKKSLPGPAETKSKREPIAEATESNHLESKVEKTVVPCDLAQISSDAELPLNPGGESDHLQTKNSPIETPMEVIGEESSETEDALCKAPLENFRPRKSSTVEEALATSRDENDKIKEQNAEKSFKNKQNEANGKPSQTAGDASMLHIADQPNIDEKEKLHEKEEKYNSLDSRDDFVPADTNLDVRASLGIFGYLGEEEINDDGHEPNDENGCGEKEEERNPQIDDSDHDKSDLDFSGVSLIERLVSASAQVLYEHQSRDNTDEEMEEEKWRHDSGSEIKDEEGLGHQEYMVAQEEDEYDPDEMEFNPFLFGQAMLQRQVSGSIMEEEREADNVINYKFSEPYAGHGIEYAADMMQCDLPQDQIQNSSEEMAEQLRSGDEKEEEMPVVAPPRRRRSSQTKPAVDATPIVPPRRRKSQRLLSEATEEATGEATGAKFSGKEDTDLMPPPTAPSRKKKSRKDDKENNMPRPQSEPNISLPRASSNPDVSSAVRESPSPVHTSPFV